MNATKTKLNRNIILTILATMSRDELRDCAANLNVAKGKDKENTMNNLADAFEADNGRFQVIFTIKSNPPAGCEHGCTKYHQGKLRSYNPPVTFVHADAPASVITTSQNGAMASSVPA